MKTVADFCTDGEYDYHEMARAVLDAGADETDDRMPVQDWLEYGDLDNTDTVAELAADYNQEHETWRKE